MYLILRIYSFTNNGTSFNESYPLFGGGENRKEIRIVLGASESLRL